MNKLNIYHYIISKAVREIITNAYILDQINGFDHAQNNENLCDNAENIIYDTLSTK